MSFFSVPLLGFAWVVFLPRTSSKPNELLIWSSASALAWCSHSQSSQSSLQVIVLLLDLFLLSSCRLGEAVRGHCGLSRRILEPDLTQDSIVDVLSVCCRARILHHFEGIAHHFRLDACLFHLHGERLHRLHHLLRVHVRVDRLHDLGAWLERLEDLLVHLHACHLVLHDSHLAGHSSVLVSLSSIPGNVLGQNLGSVVLASLRQPLDLLHGLCFLTLKRFDLSFELAVRSSDDTFLLASCLFWVNFLLFVSHIYCELLSRGVY